MTETNANCDQNGNWNKISEYDAEWSLQKCENNTLFWKCSDVPGPTYYLSETEDEAKTADYVHCLAKMRHNDFLTVFQRASHLCLHGHIVTWVAAACRIGLLFTQMHL